MLRLTGLVFGVSDGLFRKSSVEYDDQEDKELYNKVCKQRELERRVRKSKTEADMLEAAGDTEGAKEVRRKMAEQNKQLKAYCEGNGLKYRSDRVRTYGGVKPETPSSLAESIDKPTKSDIIKSYHKADTKSYTKSGSNLFDNSSKKALVNSEKEIAANDFETAIIYSEIGERIFDYTNGGDIIRFSASELRKIPSGAVITHNHPNGTVPSPQDVAFLLNRDISEIRACNKCGAYVIRKIPGRDKYHLDLEDISKEFFGYSNSLSAEYNERAVREGKSIFEYLCEIDERSWKSFCDNHGLEFIWEERI